jgi:hypothetical protein
MSDSAYYYLSIEEAMAKMAQANKPFTGLKRLLAKVQELLRAIGLDRLADSLEAKTDAEALAMLNKADMFIREGKTATQFSYDALYPAFMDARFNEKNNDTRFMRSDDKTDTADMKTKIKDGTDVLLQTAFNKFPSRLPHMTIMESALKSPEYYEHPVFKRIVDIFIHDREEIFHQTMEYLNKKGEDTVPGIAKKLKYKGISIAGRIKGKTSEEYRQLSEYIDRGDREHIRPEDMLLLMKKQNASPDTISAWKAMRESYDKALDILTEQMKEIKATKEKELNFASDSLYKALIDAMSMMKEWRGSYAPRIRQGDWVVTAYKTTPSNQPSLFPGDETTNKIHHREQAWGEVSARILAKKLEREGWKIKSIGEVQKLPEDVYQDVKTAGVAKAIDAALNKMRTSADDQKKADIDSFNESLLSAVADIIKERGYRSAMIHRNKEVVTGYIEDALERHIIYTGNISRGYAKKEAARKAMDELLGKQMRGGRRIGGINPKTEPRVYVTATDYIKEQLRNADTTDRLIGWAKSIVTFKLLGFSARSALVNTTSVITTAPPAIHEFAGKRKIGFMRINRELAKAGREMIAYMVRGSSSAFTTNEMAFLTDAHSRGWDNPQYTREMTSAAKGMSATAWNRIMDVSMMMFGATEKWNRLSTLLAAYRVAVAAGETQEQAAMDARTATEKAHGIYGKATLPSVAWGSNPTAKAAQMLYVYSKFSHNWMQLMYQLGATKGNIQAFLYALIAPMIISGMAAFPFKNQLFWIAGKLLATLGIIDDGEDPERKLWAKIRELLGGDAEVAGRYGISGAMGVDLSGSFSVSMEAPKNIWDLLGPIGSLGESVVQAKEDISAGRGIKWLERVLPSGAANVSKAYREYEEGVTTNKGRIAIDEEGKPLKPTGVETALRGAGFRSSRAAVASERLYEGKRQADNYTAERGRIFTKYRAYFVKQDKNPKDFEEIRQMVRDYNSRIRDLKLSDEIPSIKFSEMRRRINKEMRGAGKRERAMLQ